MTIETRFDQLTNKRWRRHSITWPPDVFALVATVLQESGAYLTVVEKWPPTAKKYRKHSDWEKDIKKLAAQWRKSCVRRRNPRRVSAWWRTILEARKVPFSKLAIPNNQKVCEALLSICAVADEASAGIGVNDPNDSFLQLAEMNVWNQRTKSEPHMHTLCVSVDPSVVRVLPKLHTPQSGLTIRSLSHHLALCKAGEVEPRFIYVPGITPRPKKTLNLLLVPWPAEVFPTHFQPLKKGKPGLKSPKGFGNFQFKANGGAPWHKKQFEAILDESRRHVKSLDGIIMPELCFNDAKEVKEAWEVSRMHYPDSFLFSGFSQSQPDGAATNSAACIFPPGIPFTQAKHHAWALDEPQLHQYSLCGQLDPSKRWWEDTKLESRKLNFFRLSPWLTICCLICEDLSRQDPVAELVRSIGPNLVVGLLMDGPQLANRWPARYAAVLSEDPGCSVLTLSNLGMVRQCRPIGTAESRVIALWKDGNSGARPIELPLDSGAAILSLRLRPTTEYTADGRSDAKCTGNWALQGIHFVRGG